MTQSTTPPDTVTSLTKAARAFMDLNSTANYVALQHAIVCAERASIQPAGDAESLDGARVEKIDTVLWDAVTHEFVHVVQHHPNFKRQVSAFAHKNSSRFYNAADIGAMSNDLDQFRCVPPVCTPVQAAPDAETLRLAQQCVEYLATCNPITKAEIKRWAHDLATSPTGTNDAEIRAALAAPAVQAAPVGAFLGITLQGRKRVFTNRQGARDFAGNSGAVEEIETFATEVKQDASALDGCKMCLGAKGGVPGNENIIGGVVVCDYCTSKLMDMKAAGWFSVPEVKQGELPPLPEDHYMLWPQRRVVYDADHMHAYVLADRAARQPSAAVTKVY